MTPKLGQEVLVRCLACGHSWEQTWKGKTPMCWYCGNEPETMHCRTRNFIEIDGEAQWAYFQSYQQP